MLTTRTGILNVTTLAATVGKWVLGTLVILGLVAIVSWTLRRRRSDVWQQLARRRGLKFVETTEGPRISGEVEGRRVQIATDTTSSDQDVGGVAVVQMSVALRGVPADMRAEGIPGIIGDLAALTEDRVHFDGEMFDRHVLIRGENEAAIRQFWSESRQQTFLELVERELSDQIAIENAALIAEVREIVSDRQILEAILDSLLTAASRLDGSRTAKDS